MTTLLDLFDQHQRRRGLRDGTIGSRRGVLSRYLTFLDAADTTPWGATHHHVEAFLELECNVDDRAKYTYTSHIACFYRWAVREDLTERNPTDRIDRPRLPRRRPRPMDEENLVLAVQLADPVMKAKVLAAAFEGLRCHEIAGLYRDDIVAGGRRPVVFVRDGKGGHQRVVPLHPAFLEAIHHAQLPTRGRIFTTKAGRPCSGTYMSHSINGYLHSLGIDETAHQLRHWFGTELYYRTKDIRLVQELLGHASIAQTAQYTAFALDEDVVAAVQAIRLPAIAAL